MSTKKKTIIALICISLIIISFFGGQSYSKYVSKITGKGVAEIATWSFKVNGNGQGQTQTTNISKKQSVIRCEFPQKPHNTIH